MSDLYVGSYWAARKEDLQQSADRLLACLVGLKERNPAFAQWYEKGTSRMDSLKRPVDLRNNERLSQILEAGRHRRDADGSSISELGFHCGLWNGGSGTMSASISVTCGSHSANPNLRNAVVITLPTLSSGLSCAQCYLDVLKTVAEAWEPEWGGVISESSRNARCSDPAAPFVDWMLYINRIDIDHANLPATAKAVNVAGKGTVIIVQERPIDPNQQLDLANVDKVAAILDL
jgi:hypothetical protein